ncbi:hypothetical protein SAMN05444920_11382 [Nonomuraea solani]|uniref:Lipoprotein LprG n=1 Tax=Nonomuraea solani TaxID=1144553 RepID=A0A1H6ER56_9ACTN|nr:hypothetical protein [Nonomuraea solani]SEG99486.1 hypothetical protein SAMN05444920_11382 [Nonomuraea solani]
MIAPAWPRFEEDDRMRLWALALTITSVALVVPPSAVAETRLDPVAALRRQLASGNAVTFSNVTVFKSWDGEPRTFRRSGVHELARGEVIASEFLEPKDGKDPERFIIFPDRYYEQSSFWGKRLPEGKSWGVTKEKWPLALTCGDMRLSHPATLKALLAGTKAKRPAGVYDGTRTTLHEGIITLGEVAKADPDLRVLNSRPTGTYAQVRINWKLWIGKDQLVRRCQSSSLLPGWPGKDDLEPMQFVDDVRLSRWGRATDIEPPAADQVATHDELIDAPE